MTVPLTCVTVTEQDAATALDLAGFEAAGACASCGRATPTERIDAVGWVARLCPADPDAAICMVAGFPLHSVLCPACARRDDRAVPK